MDLDAVKKEVVETCGLDEFSLEDAQLDESGPLPGGVIKDRRVPLTASLRYAPNPGMSARVFAGAAFAQQLEFMDSEGHTADKVDADPSLVAGVSGSVRF